MPKTFLASDGCRTTVMGIEPMIKQSNFRQFPSRSMEFNCIISIPSGVDIFMLTYSSLFLRSIVTTADVWVGILKRPAICPVNALALYVASECLT